MIDERPLRHEESDVDVRAILGFAGGLSVVVMLVLVVIWLFFRYMDRGEPAELLRDPMTSGQERRLPPEPQLQKTPRADLRAFRASEDELLTRYEWIDRQAGIVRIPITEAMKLAVQRGLPSRTAAGENVK